MNIKNKYIKVAREANVDLEIYTNLIYDISENSVAES